MAQAKEKFDWTEDHNMMATFVRNACKCGYGVLVQNVYAWKGNIVVVGVEKIGKAMVRIYLGVFGLG